MIFQLFMSLFYFPHLPVCILKKGISIFAEYRAISSYNLLFQNRRQAAKFKPLKKFGNRRVFGSIIFIAISNTVQIAKIIFRQKDQKSKNQNLSEFAKNPLFPKFCTFLTYTTL